MQNYTIPASAHRANARKMLGDNIFSNTWMMALLIMMLYSLIIGAISSITGGIATLILVGPLSFGLTQSFIQISRRGEAKIETMFSHLDDDFVQKLLIGLMTGLFTFLWSLLFIIPGIVKSYAYSMTYYIKCDNPSYDWKQCIDMSQHIMNGKKWKLFCLDLSFIGWEFVCCLTYGIGYLWLNPYRQAAHTSFYESIKTQSYYNPGFNDPNYNNTNFNPNYNNNYYGPNQNR